MSRKVFLFLASERDRDGYFPVAMQAGAEKTAMIGSLDIQTKSFTTADFQVFIDDYHGAYPFGQKHYSAMFMRPFDLPVSVHYKHDITGSSKLQFLDMPSLTLDTCVQVYERLFEGDAHQQRVVRLHLGCDVFGVPMSWFRETMRVRYKQNSDLYGRVNSESTQQRVQTLYFGGKTNGFTVYDKTAERLNEYKKLIRKAKHAGITMPHTFDEINGFSEKDIRTRIECKFDSQRVPTSLETVGHLLLNVADFNPFSNVIFCTDTEDWPCIETLGLQVYRKVVTFQQDQKKFGFDKAYKRLHTFSGGNGAREFKAISAALNAAAKVCVTVEQLIALYKNSVTAQLSPVAK